MTSAMATTPPVLSPSSTLGSGGMFCSDQLYESPRLTGGIVSSFISSAGGGDIGVKGSISGAVSTNECKMVEVHGVKVASFKVDGQELICLPQVFDLFLKHLVGGLHTVYTKLKRLDICPVVCTVEQVRILRGLGAIQPGVNRCKLISRKDFEALYNDCTNASSRPGRPPKRSLGVGMQDSPHLLHHGVHSLLAPSLLTHTGLTAAAMAEAMKLQKMKLMMNLQSASTQNGSESEPEDTHSNTAGGETCWEREKLQSPASGGVQHGLSNSQLSSLPHNHLLANKLDLPFMMMPHPLLPVSLPPASVAMAMNQMNHLNTIANMAAAAHIHSPLSRATSVIKQERMEETPSPAPSMDGTAAPSSQHSSQQCSSSSSTPTHILSPQRPMLHAPNGELSDKEAVLHVRKAPSEKVEDCMLKSAGFEKLPAQMLPSGFPGPLLFADSLSSVETLLTNIQGLLKVAVENARVQDKQLQQERKELKMELYREREMRESLERQLTSELHSRATIQRRLKKEKKAKRKLQEALEFESKRREQVEQALQQTTSPDTLRMSLNEAVLPEMKAEHNGSPPENSTTQESRAFMKTPIMF